MARALFERVAGMRPATLRNGFPIGLLGREEWDHPPVFRRSLRSRTALLFSSQGIVQWLDIWLLRKHNVITMRTKIITIGNSRGVRIPKILLEETGMTKTVELKVIGESLRISPIRRKKSTSDTALLSETALAKDWNRPEEDAAWHNL